MSSFHLFRGTLQALLHPADASQRCPLNLQKRLYLSKQIVQGMDWLHSHSPPYLHLDLKPSNILLDDEYNVKICDLGTHISIFSSYHVIFRLTCPTCTTPPPSPSGLPRVLYKVMQSGGMQGPIGSPAYLAPEMLLHKEIDQKADVYSFGIMLWEVMLFYYHFTRNYLI